MNFRKSVKNHKNSVGQNKFLFLSKLYKICVVWITLLHGFLSEKKWTKPDSLVHKVAACVYTLSALQSLQGQKLVAYMGSFSCLLCGPEFVTTNYGKMLPTFSFNVAVMSCFTFCFLLGFLWLPERIGLKLYLSI